MRPKILLDQKVWNLMQRYYSFPVEEKGLGNECFSHPAMDSHWCNATAKLKGGVDCTYCGHQPGHICEITCHIHQFCLAAYATRLGIGGEDPISALKKNIKLSYKALYKAVEAALSQDAQEAPSSTPEAPPATTSETKKEAAPKPPRKPRKKKKAKAAPAPVAEETLDSDTFNKERVSGDLLTLVEAAKVWDCSYVNVYNHSRKGNLTRIWYDGKAYVRRDDLERFRPNLRQKGAKSKVMEEAQVPLTQ